MDEDLRAMVQIKEALSGLDERALARVLNWAATWAADVYGISIRTEGSKKATEGSQKETEGEDQDEDTPAPRNKELDTIASLYDAARPSSEADKVLVVGYWLQKVQGQETLEAQDVNNELKNLGYAIKNITRAFSALMNQKPQLAVHVRKSGSTQQARKQYKITTAGLHKVDEMLGRRPDGTEASSQ